MMKTLSAITLAAALTLAGLAASPAAAQSVDWDTPEWRDTVAAVTIVNDRAVEAGIPDAARMWHLQKLQECIVRVAGDPAPEPGMDQLTGEPVTILTSNILACGNAIARDIR